MLVDTVKRCIRCGEEKPLDEFPRYWSGAKQNHYHRGDCRDCRAEWQRDHAKTDKRKRQQKDAILRRTYGITLEQYEEILRDQGGGCAICGAVPDQRSLDVDHCHETGAVRGLLCGSCNNGIGRFQDDPDLLEQAAEYLRCS